MKFLSHLPLALASAFVGLLMTCSFATPATAQDYWEYDRWESEWEHHYPTQGLKYEYEGDGTPEAESEQYEWEPGEGYHEQEWYDPSDWFETDGDVDYESDRGYDYDGGYDYGYDDDYGYGYDYYTDDRYDDGLIFERWYWAP